MCPGSGHYLHCIIQVYFKACLKLLRQNKNKISITDYEHNLVMGPFFYYKQKENSFHILSTLQWSLYVNTSKGFCILYKNLK